jgi:hypothetical protein
MASSQELITKAKSFNPSLTSYKPAKVNKRGGKNVSVVLNGHNLVLQFPLMMTWGVNEWDSDDSSFKKYDMNLQFNTSDESTSEGAFFHALEDFQEKVLMDAVTNSKEWFGKSKMSREVAEALMYPVLKYPKDKQTGEPDKTRLPTMKLKIPYWEDVFKVELYDMDRQALYLPKGDWDKTPTDLVPSRSHVKGLLECTGLWFAGGKFGVSWKLVQAQVRPPVRIQGFCILDDSDDEDVETELDNQDTSAAQDFTEEKPKPVKRKAKKKKKVVGN